MDTNIPIATVSTVASRGNSVVIAKIATGKVLKANASECFSLIIRLRIWQICTDQNAKTNTFTYFSHVGTRRATENIDKDNYMQYIKDFNKAYKEIKEK